MSLEFLTRLHEHAFITESVGSSEHEGTNQAGEKVKYTISFTKRAKKEHGGVTEQYTVDKVSPSAEKIDDKTPTEWALSKLSPKKEIKEAARQGESTFAYKDGQGKEHSISCTWEFEGGSYAILNVEVNGKPSTNPKIEAWCEKQCLNGNVAAGVQPSRQSSRYTSAQDDYSDDNYGGGDDHGYGNSADSWRRGFGESYGKTLSENVNVSRTGDQMVEAIAHFIATCNKSVHQQELNDGEQVGELANYGVTRETVHDYLDIHMDKILKRIQQIQSQ